MLNVESNLSQLASNARFGEVSDRKDTMMMRQLIMRNKHEFKYRTRDTDYDPMALVNKCAFIKQGYVKSKPGEVDLVKKKGLTLDEQYAQDRAFIFASMFFKMETSQQIVSLSLR